MSSVALAKDAAYNYEFVTRVRDQVARVPEGKTAKIGPVTPAKPIDTPFVSVPGLLTAQCVSNDKGSYLEVTVNGDPKDSRADDIAGDVVVNGNVVPSWGLHLIDVNEAFGNLLDIVRTQTKAYLAKPSR